MAEPILVTGTVAYDTIETPFGRAERALGGSATYFAAAASLFAPVRLVAVVGGDFARRDLAFLDARGVDLAGLEVDGAGKTFHWSGRYHYDLNNRDTLATDLNVLASFDPKVPAAYRDSRIVFLANLMPALQLKVLEQVRDPRLVVMDTMDFWMTPPFKDDLAKVIARVNVLIVNDSEARELASEPNLVKAASAIRKMGPGVVIIKKGEHGALLFGEDGVFSAPAYPLETVFDPTGAGDTFAGGFVGSLAASEARDDAALRRAVIRGSAAASFTVEEFGVKRLARATRNELDERTRAFLRLTRFDE